MQEIFETIESVAKTDSSIIIYGESGTGVMFCRKSNVDTCCLPPEIRGEITTKEAPVPCEEFSLDERLRVFEKDTITKTLEDTGGKKKEAAKRLGISRETLWRKLKEYGFHVSPEDEG